MWRVRDGPVSRLRLDELQHRASQRLCYERRMSEPLVLRATGMLARSTAYVVIGVAIVALGFFDASWLFAGALLAMYLVVYLRLRGMRIVIDDAGVTKVSVLTRQRFAWDDIVAYRFVSRDPAANERGVKLALSGYVYLPPATLAAVAEAAAPRAPLPEATVVRA